MSWGMRRLRNERGVYVFIRYLATFSHASEQRGAARVAKVRANINTGTQLG